MRILDEFKQFAVKGSMVDLAIGVVIGGAFGKIVSSLVDNIIMPPIGLLIGGINFTQLKFVLKAAAANSPEVAIGYGIFVQNLIDFLIIAWALFLTVKFMNRLREELESPKPQPQPAATPEPPEDIVLLREIRDSLKVHTERP